MKTACKILCLLLLPVWVYGQADSTYTLSYLERSTKFAWTTLGGDLFTLTGGSTEYLQAGTLRTTRLGNTYIPRVTIGGIHFWGHADFYVTFPLSFLAMQKTPAGLAKFANRQGIETGIRLYPLRLQPRHVSPFAGISMQLKTYSHVSEENRGQTSPRFQRMVAPLQAGLTYTGKHYLVTVASYYQFLQNVTYSLSPAQTGRVHFNPLSFQVGFLRYWDTDRSMRTSKSAQQLNRMEAILRKERRMSTWYWGVGPSAGLQMSRSEFLRNNYPYLYDDFLGGFMLDLTFGRFFEKPDVNAEVSYRTLGTRLRGFDASIKLRRHSFMVESYKNLFNWLGFVPFVGITGSLEALSARVGENTYAATKPALGVIAGWDIRVTKTGTNVLRTNLRWTPGLHLKIDNQKLMFDQLEFNFIQWIQFIGRKKAYQKYRS